MYYIAVLITGLIAGFCYGIRYGVKLMRKINQKIWDETTIDNAYELSKGKISKADLRKRLEILKRKGEIK